MMDKNSTAYKIECKHKCPYCNRTVYIFDTQTLENNKYFTVWYCLNCDKSFKLTHGVEGKYMTVVSKECSSEFSKPTPKQLKFFKKIEEGKK